MKRFLCFVSLIAILASCGGEVEEKIDTTLWSGSGGDSMRTSLATGEIVAPFGKMWEAEINGLGVSSIAVALVPPEEEKDRLTAVYRLVIASGNDGAVYGIDFDTGMKMWEKRVEGMTGNPLYYSGKVFISTTKGFWHCLSAWTGDEMWSARYSEKELDRPENATPVVYSGKLYCAHSNGVLFCFDANKGTELWKKVFKDSIQCSPVIVEGKIILSTYEMNVVALDPDNGKELWNSKVESPVTTTLVSDGKLIFAPQAFGVVSAFDVADGREAWKTKACETIAYSPCLTKSGLMAIPDKKAGKIVFVRLSSGTVDSEVKVPWPSSGLVAAGDMVCFATEDGKIYSVDAIKKQAIESFDFGTKGADNRYRKFGDPCIIQGRLLISDGASKLYMFVPKGLEPRQIENGNTIVPGNIKEKEIVPPRNNP